MKPSCQCEPGGEIFTNVDLGMASKITHSKPSRLCHLEDAFLLKDLPGIGRTAAVTHNHMFRTDRR